MDLPSFIIGLVVAWIIALIFYSLQVRREAAEDALHSANAISLSDHLSQMQSAEARITELETAMASLHEQRETEVAAVRDQYEGELVTAREQCESELAAARAEIERLQQAQTEPVVTEAEEAAPVAVAPEAAAETAPLAEADVQELHEVAEPTVTPEAPAITPDDLKRIEGVGPKIAELLNNAGIYTFAQLADADLAHLRTVLADAGERYRMADPHTWAQQARLAASGQWEELAALQDDLKGGR